MTFEEWIQKLKEAGGKAGKAPWELVGEYKKDSDYKIKLPNGRVFKIGDALYHQYDFDAAFITLARNEWDTMISLLESYREALENIDKTLQIPAAEFVPAISDVFNILDKTKSKEPWREK